MSLVMAVFFVSTLPSISNATEAALPKRIVGTGEVNLPKTYGLKKFEFGATLEKIKKTYARYTGTARYQVTDDFGNPKTVERYASFRIYRKDKKSDWTAVGVAFPTHGGLDTYGIEVVASHKGIPTSESINKTLEGKSEAWVFIDYYGPDWEYGGYFQTLELGTGTLTITKIE